MTRSRDDLRNALRDPQVRAFLRAIRLGEGTKDENGYRRIVGGGNFESFADHPRVFRTVAGIRSSAAGAYQFLSKTWDALVTQYGFPDFAPRTQDEGAVALIIGRGALPALQAGRIEEAVRHCAKEWASLPGSPYGQPTVTMPVFLAEYKKWLSTFLAAGGVTTTVPQAEQPAAPAAPIAVPTTEETLAVPPPGAQDATTQATTQAPAPVEDRSTEYVADTEWPFTHPQSRSDYAGVAATVGKIALGAIMPQASILATVAQAAIPALINFAPELVKIFTDKGGNVSDRNTAAAIKVLEIAQQATGAANAQAAVETLLVDPQAQASFREAVQTQWFSLDPQAVAESRKFAADNPQAMSILRYVTAAALGFLGFANIAVYVLLGVGMALDLKEVAQLMQMASTIQQADIGTALVAVGYWLGSSNGSDRKTTLMSGGSQ